MISVTTTVGVGKTANRCGIIKDYRTNLREKQMWDYKGLQDKPERERAAGKEDG
jgi:hypothetical protein